jgi:two-component system, chemotaxis family, chemotaxis protein CheY
MNKERQNILIVDDSRIFTKRLSTLLKESGSEDEINTVENYEDALQSLAAYKPDLVFLDIHLHNKSGIDLLRVIRLSQWNCKVIMLTNETKKAYRQQCERLGSSGFLDKSNDFESIPELVKML